MMRHLRLLTFACLALGAFLGLTTNPVAQESKRFVYVVPIEGMIDLGLAPFIQRVLKEASDNQAAAVVLEINTFGGRVDAAVQIRDALLDSNITTIAFINKRAISAGALISLASSKIAMASGGTIGAATPVQAGQPGEGAKPVEEKTVSYVSKEFRSTAEARDRPPRIAEAMVDADVAIPNVINKGKLLTLTTAEAIRLKVADIEANTVMDALVAFGISDAELLYRKPNWAENIVRTLTHPVVSSLLISIALVGILVELRTPGFGFAGAIGISSLSLFLWGHWIAQLAGWEEVLIALAGIVLLVIELFVIPGFGIVGILGILAILAGLVLSLVGAGDTPQVIMMSVMRVMISLGIAIVVTLVLMKFLPRTPFGRRLVLETELSAGSGFDSSPPSDHRLIGKQGVSSTPLHPSGIAEFHGERVDVVSEGELIDAGVAVKVVKVDGNRVVVRRHLT
jgi:membrane-bound serine protease (ClpP class)